MRAAEVKSLDSARGQTSHHSLTEVREDLQPGDQAPAADVSEGWSSPAAG